MDEILTSIKGHKPVRDQWKMMLNNLKLDIVIINTYLIGEIISTCFQDNEHNRNYDRRNDKQPKLSIASPFSKWGYK